MENANNNYISKIEEKKFKDFNSFYESDEFYKLENDKELQRKTFYYFALKFSSLSYKNILELYKDLNKILDKIQSNKFHKKHDENLYVTIINNYLEKIEIFNAESTFYENQKNIFTIKDLIKLFSKHFKEIKCPKKVFDRIQELYEILLVKKNRRVEPGEKQNQMKRYLEDLEKLLDKLKPKNNDCKGDKNKNLFHNNNLIQKNNINIQNNNANNHNNMNNKNIIINNSNSIKKLTENKINIENNNFNINEKNQNKNNQNILNNKNFNNSNFNNINKNLEINNNQLNNNLDLNNEDNKSIFSKKQNDKYESEGLDFAKNLLKENKIKESNNSSSHDNYIYENLDFAEQLLKQKEIDKNKNISSNKEKLDNEYKSENLDFVKDVLKENKNNKNIPNKENDKNNKKEEPKQYTNELEHNNNIFQNINIKNPFKQEKGKEKEDKKDEENVKKKIKKKKKEKLKEIREKKKEESNKKYEEFMAEAKELNINDF